MYLTQNEYITFGGVEDVNFITLEFRAEKIINKATFYRLKKFDMMPEETQKSVKMCIFELIKLLNEYSGDNVSGWNNNGISVTYQSISQAERSERINKTIRDYLLDCVDDEKTPLMYCGVPYAT